MEERLENGGKIRACQGKRINQLSERHYNGSMGIEKKMEEKKRRTEEQKALGRQRVVSSADWICQYQDKKLQLHLAITDLRVNRCLKQI